MAEPFNNKLPQIINSIYLHIPFCSRKCCYCDFYSIDAANLQFSDIQIYFINTLLTQLRQLPSCYNLQISSIFIGGGTPSCLNLTLWEIVLKELQHIIHFNKHLEFTVEANPESLTLPLLQLLRRYGVNRLSLGGQSFQPHLLANLNRLHNPDQIRNALAMAKSVGFDNINLDLMFAIPGQTTTDLASDLQEAISLQPQHISYYSLTYEPNTVLTQMATRGKINRTSEELESVMYEVIIDYLQNHDYEHYEISNWAKSGFRCLHNTAYWVSKNWLGFGPSAASHVNGKRWKYVPDLVSYIENTSNPPTCENECLPEDRKTGELIMMRLRLIEGMPLDWLENILSPNDPRSQTISNLIQQNLLQQTSTHLRLSRKGIFLADYVTAQLL